MPSEAVIGEGPQLAEWNKQDRAGDGGRLWRELTAEFVATCFLLAAVVGSGIMAESLARGNVALALLANSLATGTALVALIVAFGPISGAHMNPAVSVACAMRGQLPWWAVPGYVAAQTTGAVGGVAVAHTMFGLPLFVFSRHARGGGAQIFSEFIATFGLIAVIWGGSRAKGCSIAYAVAAYITAAYWFTSSTSFANPAVTLARCLTDTFSGIRPLDAWGFMAAQFAGAVAGTIFWGWLDEVHRDHS